MTADVDRERALLSREVMNLGARGASGKKGEPGVLATFGGHLDAVPDHLFWIAERYDLTVVHRATERGGRGVETRVELATEERHAAIDAHLADSERDAFVVDRAPSVARAR